MQLNFRAQNGMCLIDVYIDRDIIGRGQTKW
jgi:hypothetical protein